MAIKFSSVNVVVQDVHILHDISLHLEKKRIACVGCNGSGKSTLARAACGIVPHLSGTIHIYGKEMKKSQAWKDVNMCFQIPERQIIMPSVVEELKFGLVNAGFDDDLVQEKIDYALSILKLDSHQPCWL